MPTYLVEINGTNFLVDLDGEVKRLGFFTQRQVEAANPEEAEAKAMDSMRALKLLREATRNSPEDSPMMYVTSLSEIECVSQPTQGLTWYPDDDTEG